jgi:hypothetical protein
MSAQFELPADLKQFAQDTFQKGYQNYIQNKHVNNSLPAHLRCPSKFNAGM